MVGDPLFPSVAGRRRLRRRGALSLAPLIDVTFILLIFFMLVTRFSDLAPVSVTLGAVESVALTDTGAGAGAAGAKDRGMRLAIRADGGMRLDGRPLATLDALEAALRPAGGLRRARPVVLIVPDENVPLQILLDLLARLEEMAAIESRLLVPYTGPEARGGARGGASAGKRVGAGRAGP